MYTTGPLPVCQYEMEIKSLGKLRRGQKSVAEIHIPFAASYDPSKQRFPPRQTGAAISRAQHRGAALEA